ncbi:MAG: hypothetical protein AABY26_02535 [Nanoarchaeota archaeon]
MAGGETGKKAWVINGLFNDGQNSNLPVQEFKIGANGDYCDGKASASCYLRILADSEDKFWEGAEKEKDNQLWLYVSVTNQKVTTSTTVKKNRAIELVINDEGSADPEQKAIEQVCLGYIGYTEDSDGYTCNSFETSSTTVATCASGELPSEKGKDHSAPWSSSKGCLVVVTEDDPMNNDCGYFGADDSEVVDTLVPNKITKIKTNFIEVDGGGGDAHNALAYQWSSSPDFGSQLCKSDWWYQCDQSAENQMVVLGEVRYRCEKTRWVKMD